MQASRKYGPPSITRAVKFGGLIPFIGQEYITTDQRFQISPRRLEVHALGGLTSNLFIKNLFCSILGDHKHLIEETFPRLASLSGYLGKMQARRLR